MVKNVAILGSTGSIGTNALRVIQALGPGYRVVALAARNSVELLAEQVKQFNPDYVAVTNPDRADELTELLGDYEGQILCGDDSLVEIAKLDQVDILLTALVGAAGLPPVLEAAKLGKTLAIANKEPLVMAGQLLTDTAKANNATILPIDSEHSAIFQSMQAGRPQEVKRIILTASGGPFRKATAEDMEKVTIEDALAHPTWNMGPKITIDSATMMNKALEIIEAVWLFGVSADKIDVLVHPESIVHSLVEYIDNSVIAQLGTPDMKVPIQYALTYPDRCEGIAEGLKLEDLGCLTFEKPNPEVFRALELVYEVANLGGTAGAVFNAANEVAVAEFLAGRIKFTQIIELVELCISKHKVTRGVSLEQLLQADRWAREQVREYRN